MEVSENGYSVLRKGWMPRTVLFFCALIFTYWALVSAAPLFPASGIDENLRDSYTLLEQEGIYTRPFGLMPATNPPAEALMLNIIGTLEPSDPIRSAMRMNVSYLPGSQDAETNWWIGDFKNFLEGKATETWSYGRYWHGYVSFLRPMLSVMGLAEIRKLSFFVLMALFSAAVVLLARRLNWTAALGFAVSMALGGFPLLAFSLDYVDSFFVALTVMCAILRWNIRDEECLVRLFLVSGSLPIFLSFGGLNAPIVTFMFPLLSLILLDLELSSFRWDWRYVKRIFLFGAAWSVGYLLTWASKWVLADMILGNSFMVRDAINSISIRTGNAASLTLFDRLFAIAKNIYAFWPFSIIFYRGEEKILAVYADIVNNASASGEEGIVRLASIINEILSLLPPFILCGLVVTALFIICYLSVVACLALNRQRRRPIGLLGYLSLSFLFLLPYFWYFLTAEHAKIHYWFTFRNQIPSLWMFLILPGIMKKR